MIIQSEKFSRNTMDFIYTKSAGLKFENYNDTDELPHLQDYFTTNDKQFNYGGDFNQEP